MFVGPCLGDRHPRTLAKSCTVLPPVTRGDIQHLIAETELPGTIAVIDGYFEHELAVSHEELCVALDQGWQVWGISAMGAIRAYELRYEGMQGYGQVYRHFEKYADFRDDEVVCIHGLDPPYPTHSEPMVHLRAAIQWLVRSGRLAVAEGRRVRTTLERMWFADRTMDCFLALLRGCDPPVTAVSIDAMLDHFSQFQLKLRDVDQFLLDQPWLNGRAKH